MSAVEWCSNKEKLYDLAVENKNYMLSFIIFMLATKLTDEEMQSVTETCVNKREKDA